MNKVKKFGNTYLAFNTHLSLRIMSYYRYKSGAEKRREHDDRMRQSKKGERSLFEVGMDHGLLKTRIRLGVYFQFHFQFQFHIPSLSRVIYTYCQLWFTVKIRVSLKQPTQKNDLSNRSIKKNILGRVCVAEFDYHIKTDKMSTHHGIMTSLSPFFIIRNCSFSTITPPI